MDNYWLTLLGILVAIVFSILGYRQTVGARRERIRAANSELEKILIRRVVLESYQPTVDDLSRLINGKARDYRIRRGDLLSETQLLENIFTRITESDFMTQDRRKEVLERLSPVFAKAEKISEEVLQFEVMPVEEEKRAYTRQTSSLTIGFTASFIGTVVIIIISLLSEGTVHIRTIIVVFAGSMALITGIFAFYRLRESAEEPSARSAIESARDFEQEVHLALLKLNIPLEVPSRSFDSGFDFMTTLGEKKMLIEVKAFSRQPSVAVLKNTIDRLNNAIKRHNAHEGIILVKSSFKLPDYILRDTNIRVLTLRELRNYMVHTSAR